MKEGKGSISVSKSVKNMKKMESGKYNGLNGNRVELLEKEERPWSNGSGYVWKK